MSDATLRDRLAQWLYETTPRRSDVGHFVWEYLPEDGHAGKAHHRQWADALLASEEWQAREAVVEAARDHRDGACTLPHGALDAALARLAALRGTT